MKISVIVPVYKVEPYLRRCVDSILNQTFVDFELILVDDGSPDNCGVICDEYARKDSRIHVIHQENGGLSAARNAAIDWIFANSDSQWLTFVDSDDWIHARYLELLMNAAETYDARISMCFFQRFRDGDAEEFVPKQVDLEVFSPEVAYTLNEPGNHIAAYACGRLYQKSLFQEIRYPVGKHWEDLFVTHRLLFACEKIAVVRAQLYYYFFNPDGIVHSPWNIHKLDAIEGYEGLLSFFAKQKLNDLLQKVAHTCGETIFSNILKVEKLDFQKKTEVKRILQKKMRNLIIRYGRKTGINMTNYCHYYEVAFPRTFAFYRFGRPVLKYPNMLRKKLRRDR